MTVFTYDDFFRGAKKRKYIVLKCVCAVMLLAFIGLNAVTPKYTGEMILGPTSQTGVAARGVRLKLETTQNEKIRGNPAETSHGEALSDFARELQLLTSPEIAAELLQKDTIGIEKNLLQQGGVGSFLKRGILRLAGQRVFVGKDAATLSNVLKHEIHIDALDRSAMRRIRFRHADRDFANALLNTLYKTADAHLRKQAQSRAASEIAYLRVALSRVTLNDQRKALTDLLAAQEQTQLMLAVDLPFAADQIQVATAPTAPDWPDIGLVLFFALCVGLFSGFSVLYALVFREWLAQQ